MVECPNCKKQLADGMKFCDSCGTPLPKMINCPNCGQPMNEEFNNCPACGAVNTVKAGISSATPATPAQESQVSQSGTIASGTISSGTISSGTISSGTISSGTIQSGTIGGPAPQPQPQPQPQMGQPAMQQQAPQQWGQPAMQQQAPQQWGQPGMQQAPGQQWGQPAPKKKKTGLIIGIIIAVVVIVAGVLVFLLDPFGWRKDANIEKLKEAQKGDIVTLGKYEQDNDKDNGKEDIEWVVLEKQEDKILLMSSKAIEAAPYNTSKADVTWETSSIRSFLNSTFISEAFEDKYRSRVLDTNVPADKNPNKSSVAQGNSTTDKVFLLSGPEMSKYLTTNQARQSYITDYAYSKGAWKGDNGEACTWLRTIGTMDTTHKNACIVQGAGSIGYNGRPVEETQSVRPVVWVNLK